LVERVALADLKDHPRNYREHPDDQVEHIGRSLKQFGQYRNVVVAKDFTILAGHGVAKAARLIGWTELDAIRLDLEPDSPAALKLLAADNQLGHFAVVDDRELTELLSEIREFDEYGLDGTGFDDMMLANLLMVTRSADEIKDVDAAAEWLGMPDYKPGKKAIAYHVFFRCEEDRQKFAEQMELPVAVGRGSSIGTVWSCWWPDNTRDDSQSVIVEG